MFDFFLFLLLLACFVKPIHFCLNIYWYVCSPVLLPLRRCNVCFGFFYIEKYKLRTRKRKLSCWDYFLHFVILLVLKVYFPLVRQKLVINCTPCNQLNRWNFRTVIITVVIFWQFRNIVTFVLIKNFIIMALWFYQ